MGFGFRKKKAGKDTTPAAGRSGEGGEVFATKLKPKFSFRSKRRNESSGVRNEVIETPQTVTTSPTTSFEGFQTPERTSRNEDHDIGPPSPPSSASKLMSMGRSASPEAHQESVPLEMPKRDLLEDLNVVDNPNGGLELVLGEVPETDGYRPYNPFVLSSPEPEDMANGSPNDAEDDDDGNGYAGEDADDDVDDDGRMEGDFGLGAVGDQEEGRQTLENVATPVVTPERQDYPSMSQTPDVTAADSSLTVTPFVTPESPTTSDSTPPAGQRSGNLHENHVQDDSDLADGRFPIKLGRELKPSDVTKKLLEVFSCETQCGDIGDSLEKHNIPIPSCGPMGKDPTSVVDVPKSNYYNEKFAVNFLDVSQR